MAVLLSDNFDRANNTSVVGAPAVGPAPVAQVGTWGISGNAIYSSAVVSTRAIITWDVGTPNVDITLTKTAGALAAGAILFGGSSVNDTWAVQLGGDGTGLWLGHYKNATLIKVREICRPPVFPLGTAFRVVHHAGVVAVYLNGVFTGKAELPQLPVGTQIGIWHTTTTHRWDNLTVEDSTAIDMTADGFVYRGRDTKIQDGVTLA